MVSPVNIMTSGVAAAETVSKNAVRAAPDNAGAKDSGIMFPTMSGSDEIGFVSEAKNASAQGAEIDRGPEKKGNELRKVEINDGEVAIKVYNNSGKLLRKIPPGYVPLGEQKFDVTV